MTVHILWLLEILLGAEDDGRREWLSGREFEKGVSRTGRNICLSVLPKDREREVLVYDDRSC
jgi:hypothetical protein